MKKITRTALVAFIAMGLAFAGVTLSATSADAASSKVKIKSTVLRPAVKMQVTNRSGAVLYSTKTGKVVRDSKGKARRLARGDVRVYTHRVRAKSRDYRRMAGKRYMVRTSTLRVAPKPRPVAKPAPKPQPKPAAPVSVPVGPHNGEATTLVFGDSISAPTDSWWASVRDRARTNFEVSAIGGTGFISAGYIGMPFANRLSLVDTVKPDFIVAAGGRNDWTFGYGQPVTTAAQKRDGIRAYMALLAAAAQRNDVPKANVYVMTPWGEADPTNRAAIVPVVKAAAAAYGFKFVDLPIIPTSIAPDGTHPNAAGSRWLADQFLARSDYAKRLAAWEPAPVVVEPTPEPSAPAPTPEPTETLPTPEPEPTATVTPLPEPSEPSPTADATPEPVLAPAA